MTIRITAAVLLLSLLTPILQAEPTRLLRQPDIHLSQVVFTYAGDLFVANTDDGVARQLTSHAGLELFGKFSPDGTQIAYSAEYNGTRQVYVIDTNGGMPRQLTWYNDVGPMPPRGGYDYRVLDWTPDGQHILVRANRLPWGPRMGRYFLVPAAGGNEKAVAIPEGGGAMFAGSANNIVYTPIDRESRTWKRYRGGRAQDVWTFDLTNNKAHALTTHAATDNQPVWVGGEIYFTSDRDYTLNLYQHVAGEKPRKVTQHDGFDVMWPSAGPNAIVYENGGRLYRLDTGSGESRALSIEVGGDRAARLPKIVAANAFIEAADLSPNGKRVLFTARGEVFSVPAEEGPTRNLSQSAQAREIEATWSPDASQIAWLSDVSGEYELWLRDSDGETRQLTTNGDIWRFAPVWSPDSSKLLFADKRQQLHVVDVKSGRQTTLDSSRHNDITDYSWAPDSRHVAYVKTNSADFDSIWIYDLDEKATHQVTTDMSNDGSPVFDSDGRYLYFISSRDFDLQFSSNEFNYMVTNSLRVFATQLNSDVPALWQAKSDEAQDAEDEDKPKKSKTIRKLNIDYAGLANRVVALQSSGGNVSQLSANSSGPLYVAVVDGENRLRQFDLASEEETDILANIQAYTLAANGESLLFNSGGHWGIAAVAPGQDASKGTLDLKSMQLRVDPAVEWQQMYVDGWRILRDWFYDPGMHGNDWPGIREKYQPLVAHVAHRSDLDYIFGEIAGEMNAGHIYVQGGDQPSVERKPGGLLGAEIEATDSAYRIAKIFGGEPWHEEFYSPLAAPGVGISEGDYILAINGRSTESVKNFYELTENLGGDVITLTVNDAPRQRGARDVRVRTITSETSLRYLDWVNERARRVDELSGGRIGYIHLPNTAIQGNRELFKRFLPQNNKEALILDARYNGGGFIPDRLIEMVARTPLNYWKRRGLDPYPTPQISHTGPKATLINGYSSSGGDAFPYYFKKLGLGPLIGKRTWGGLIGISGNPMLADGGGILASTFRFLDTDGNWAVENEGVAPDIEVLDRPDLVMAGEDPTLERAVQHLLQELGATARPRVGVPPAPSEF